MHLPDERLDFQVFRQLQDIGARKTVSEHFVEGQPRHAAVNDEITPLEKIVVPSDAGVLRIDQLAVSTFFLIITDVSSEGREQRQRPVALHESSVIDGAIDQDGQSCRVIFESVDLPLIGWIDLCIARHITLPNHVLSQALDVGKFSRTLSCDDGCGC